MANLLPSLPPLPGMAALGAYRPDATAHIGAMADTLLRDGHPDSTLSQSDRETIAAHVSSLNGCNFCSASHGAVAEALARREGNNDPPSATICYHHDHSLVQSKMKALLHLANKVRLYEEVADAIAHGKKEGASDMDVHDTVLIASYFSMVNRYVDSLTNKVEMPKEAWAGRAEAIAEHGYVKTMSQAR